MGLAEIEAMKEIEISRARLQEVMYEAIVGAACSVPRDVEVSLRNALDREHSALARLHLEMTLANIESARKEGGVSCGDTGYPLYYIVIGQGIRFEGGPSALQKAGRVAVTRATRESRLRSTMVYPLSRKNARTNCGHYMPYVDVRFDPHLSGMQIVAVLKGGGAEIYGSFFKMMLPADGREGTTRFILDSIVEGVKEGKTCPPSIVGVGIGGTSDICMRLAKEAAVLRPVGSRHPEEGIAKYEQELLEAVNSLGFGPMGTGGRTTVLDVHVEYGLSHTGALPVAVNIQCAITRRCVARITRAGEITYGDTIDWSYR